MMLYNSSKHTANFTTADVLEHIKTTSPFSKFRMAGEDTLVTIVKGFNGKVDVDFSTRDGSVKIENVHLLDHNKHYFKLQRDNATVGSMRTDNLGLEIPGGWCALGEDGLIHGSVAEIVDFLRYEGVSPDDLGANFEDWLEDHSEVQIHGVCYSALEVLKNLDEDRLDELAEECMIEYLETYGPHNISYAVEGLLWYWDDDNMTLESGRWLFGGEDYAPGFEPNFHKEWEA